MDGMVVKSLKVANHVEYFEATFKVLRKYIMRLNLLKCDFSEFSGKVLGYMVNQRGMKANLDKIKALLGMRSPCKPKEVQSLMGHLVAFHSSRPSK